MDGHDAISESEQTRNLRAPSAEPSASHRDAAGDINRSPSRKRPRLDSGSRNTRSMSADQALLSSDKAADLDDDSTMQIDSRETTPPNANGTTQHAHTPSRVTINVREHSKDSGGATTNGRRDSHDSQKATAAGDNMNGTSKTKDSSTSGSTSPHGSSSPLIEIDAEEPEEVDAVVTEIRVDGTETDAVEALFSCFPFTRDGDVVEAAEAMYAQLERGLSFMVLEHLSTWLQNLQKSLGDRTNEWNRVFYEHTSFWDILVKAHSRLFNRSVFKESSDSVGYDSDETTHKVLETFMFLLVRVLRVDTAFINDDRIIIDRAALLSTKFITAARPLLREDKGFITKVSPNFGMDPHELRRQIIKWAAKFEVLHALADMVKSSLEDTSKDDAFLTKLVNCIKLAGQFGKYAAFYRSTIQTPAYIRICKQLSNDLLSMFLIVNKQLNTSIDKQQDFLSQEIRKQIVEDLDDILRFIFRLDPERGRELFQRITGRDDIEFEDYYPALSSIVWKIKLFNTYIVKGRMELRLQGIEVMASELVKFFNEHRTNTPSVRCDDPGALLLFVSGVLCEEKIADYLLGVASHPQLITRSANIIGFLVVTNRFLKDEVQLMWRTILESQDPRIVTATLPQLSQIIKTLSTFAENVTICEVIMESSLPILSYEATAFFQDLLNTLRGNYQDYHLSPGEKEDRQYHVPPEFCIHLIRTLSAYPPQNPHARTIKDDAISTLALVSSLAPSAITKALLKKCLDIVRNSSDDGAAAAQAMYMMVKQSRSGPKAIAKDLGIAPVLMKDLCDFIDAKRATNTILNMQQLNQQIWPRLDLIWFVVPNDDDGIDEELLRRFWSHLVGADALNNTARDVAWHRLAMVAFYPGAENAFLERHEELLSPTEVKPEFFTSGFFQFVQKVAQSKIRRQGAPVLTEQGAIQLSGIDLVWNSLLHAPIGVNEEGSIQFLVATYLDKSWLQRTSKDAVEATHTALVDECINRLKDAHSSLRRRDSAFVDGEDIMMADSTSTSQKAELVFLRTIKFLLRCLLHIRTRADHRSKSVEHTVRQDDDPMPIRGVEVTIKCEIMKHGTMPTSKPLIVGSLDTCRQLHRRVCSLLAEYNFASFQLISAGKKMYLMERPRMTLEAAGLTRAPHLILREGTGTDESKKENIIPNEHWRSAFEQRIISRLEDLCSFLDGDDNVSANTFDFLKHLPRYESSKVLVAQSSADVKSAFPLDQPYKLRYSLECLREDLEERPSDEELIVHGARVLEALLTKGISKASDSARDSLLFADIVSCLFDFVIVSRGKHPDLFLNPASLAEGLIALCMRSLPAANINSLLWDCYELLFDLCLDSADAWDALRSNESVQTLHHQLLFEHQDVPVRRRINHLIHRTVDYYPPQSHVSLADFMLFLWAIMLDIIPRAVAQPECAIETLDSATFLFKKLIEGRLLDAESIRTYFSAWKEMVMNHAHEERVGKDEIDPVLNGLAVLLRLCAEAIPRELPLAAKADLTQAIWWKFLFHQTPTTADELLESAISLPVLESTTRTELVQLLSALATDTQTLEVLLRNAVKVPIEHKFYSMTDKAFLLRSPASYVGLKNLGNTCYMNALLTNLFMNPIFRSFIISCAPTTNPVDSPLLSETQKLFAIMQNSYAKFASAIDFTLKIVTLTEESIDIREQMDVDEFMNTLFIRWEDQMPSDTMKQRFRSVYTGKTMQQIKSKECDHVSEREDSCLAIQCDVQGKATLEESLIAFTEGDVMEGDNKWKCEACGRLVDAVKRTCLKEVPDHVMMQLKRFNFDFDYQRRNKINDHFAFPMSIDMNQYTFEHLSSPERPIAKDTFDLVGVIVHKGQADHGHYVSYIRARPSINSGDPTWLQFDDSDVTIFDPKDLAEACFGGLPSKDTSVLFPSGLKTYNAYMLFYQRRSSLQQHPWVIDGHIGSLQSVPLPPSLGGDILIENVNLIKDYCFFDESSREFIRCLLQKLEKLDHTETSHRLHTVILDRIWTYFAVIWARTREIPEFEEAFTHLQSICSDCDQCCFLSLKWLISCATPYGEELKYTDTFRDLILRSNQPKIRQGIRTFIVDAMKQLRYSPELYGADIHAQQPSFGGMGAIAMITRLAQFVPDSLHFHTRAWEDYFGLLADLAALGPHECWALIQEGLLTACFEVLTIGVQIGMSAQQEVETRYMLVNDALKRRVAPSYNQVIRLASILFDRVDMQAEAVSLDVADHRLEFWTENGVPWTEHEEQLLMDFNKKEGGFVWLCEVFQKWNIDDGVYVPGEILRTLLNGKGPIRHGIVETFLTSIKEFEARYADPFLHATPSLLMHLRDEDLMEKLVRLMRECSKDANGSNDRSDDGYSGFYCQRFWATLHQLTKDPTRCQITNQAYLDELFLGKIHEWAPPLILYTRDFEIGRFTHKLLKEALFESWETFVEDDVRSIEDQNIAVHRTFWSCERSIRIYMASREQPWRQFAAPLYHVMNDCAEFIRVKESAMTGGGEETVGELTEEEHIIVDRFDALKNWFDALPQHSEDELELAQSSELAADWEGLDIGDDAFEASDLTEVSDDEVGAVLTGEV